MKAFHVDQIDLVVAIGKEIDRQRKRRKLEPAMAAPRMFDAVIKAANLIVEACARADVPATPGMGLVAWLSSDDRGIASNTMVQVLCGVGGLAEREFYHPLDADDFGRCHRFLEAVPEARARLSDMASVSKQWAALVKHWDEITQLLMTDHKAASARIFAVTSNL